MKLQGRSIDVAHAYQDISMVKAALQEARRGIDTFHEIVYLDAVALAHSVEIEESCPRIASYQLHRSNTPAFNASQYYRRTLPIPMLGHLITELDNHFEEAAAGIIGELAQILPSELVSSSVQLNPSHFKEVYSYIRMTFHLLRHFIVSWIYGERNGKVRLSEQNSLIHLQRLYVLLTRITFQAFM